MFPQILMLINQHVVLVSTLINLKRYVLFFQKKLAEISTKFMEIFIMSTKSINWRRDVALTRLRG